MIAVLSTTIALAVAAVFINLWHFVRCVRARMAAKVIHGDGGDAVLQRRMRAQLNFAEHAPLFLILCGLVEMTGKGGHWLAAVGAAFMLARIAHAIGMDSASVNRFRQFGMMGTLLCEVILAIAALLILARAF